MRRLVSALPAVLLLAAVPALAADRDAALAVVADAVKAHGGADALARAQQMIRTSKGVLFAVKMVPFTDELILDLPHRFRLTVDAGGDGQSKTRIIVGLARDKAWQQTGGMAMDLGADRLEELRSDAYLLWLTTLTPLQKDDSLTLAPLPDEKVNGEPAAGVKVSKKGQPDVRLFFDKSSHLLVKADRRAREGGLEFLQEFLFSDHKDSGGVKLPTRIVESRSGRKFTELSDVKYRFLGSPDDASFNKP